MRMLFLVLRNLINIKRFMDSARNIFSLDIGRSLIIYRVD